MNRTLNHFGMTHYPLAKSQQILWDDGRLTHLKSRFDWLLESPGVGLLTGEAGCYVADILRRFVSRSDGAIRHWSWETITSDSEGSRRSSDGYQKAP